MREYLLIFLTALAVTYLLAVLARELAMRDRRLRPGARPRRARDPHPVLRRRRDDGRAHRRLHRRDPAAVPERRRPTATLIFHDARAILIGGALICLVGVIDDVYELDAITKFAGEVLAAGVVVVQGVQILLAAACRSRRSRCSTVHARRLAGGVAHDHLDHRDHRQRSQLRRRARRARRWCRGDRRTGLLLVLRACSSSSTTSRSATTAAMLTAALAGACIGFLPHNFFPARMFMGDSGALLDRLHARLLAISLTGQFPNTSIDAGIAGASASLLPALLPLILPFAVLRDSVRRPGDGGRPPHPRRAVARSPRTRSTCTTGCSRSATRSGGRSS